jgi:hypothetical protein
MFGTREATVRIEGPASQTPDRLRQIYERLGEPAKAADHYRRFLGLWKDCDPELRSQVEDAASRLARLGGERR